MSEYLALERARTYRRLFVARFGLLAAALSVAGLGLHWLSPFGLGVSVALCAIAPVWAWIVEVRCDRRLTRQLGELPPAVTGLRPIRKS